MSAAPAPLPLGCATVEELRAATLRTPEAARPAAEAPPEPEDAPNPPPILSKGIDLIFS